MSTFLFSSRVNIGHSQHCLNSTSGGHRHSLMQTSWGSQRAPNTILRSCASLVPTSNLNFYQHIIYPTRGVRTMDIGRWIQGHLFGKSNHAAIRTFFNQTLCMDKTICNALIAELTLGDMDLYKAESYNVCTRAEGVEAALWEEIKLQLDVHITQDLSWSYHISTVVKKSRQRFHHLRYLRDLRLASKVLGVFTPAP